MSGISSESQPRSSPAATTRGRTCSTQDRWTGCAVPDVSSRKLGATSHIGETANRT
ncbi:hypothetical protein [Streptomyces filipinensis]|uniref:hypothetical protein n=1 Tax=Streptomyces filipinensis TaxID=66887 RepID=UPI0027E474BE|nr:hypothetical protein [Streptomyces filipinensis]